MAYIAPNSIIELYQGIALDSNYTDTGYFQTAALKDQFFDTIAPTNRIGSYTALTFQRENINFCRISMPYSSAIRANYMRYKNTSFANKWFYAFIKSVDYINNDVVQINYINDPLMTWMGEFDLPECFVERNHSTTDIIGDNIISEPFAFNEYVVNDHGLILYDDRYVIIVAYSFSGREQVQNGVMREGIFNGLCLKAFSELNLTGLNNFIQEFGAYPDAIISIYMCPENCLGIVVPDTGSGVELPSTTTPVYDEVLVSQITDASTLDGYLPRNKKLYTFPFNYCAVTNQQGTVVNAKYEYGTVGTNFCKIDGTIFYSCLQPVTEMLKFRNYKNSNGIYYFDSLTLTGFPICNWSSDAYTAWVAQNAVPYAYQLAGSLIKADYLTPETGKMNLVDNITGILSSEFRAGLEPDIVKGNITAGNMAFSSGLLHFYQSRMSINAQFAKQVDDYFDLYGYAYNQIRQPRMASRPYWCYLKTQGCKVEGNLPAEDAAFIEDIINRGIRFWRDFRNIGNYSGLDNSLGVA